MSVLVTGSAGHLGHALCDHLNRLGLATRGVDIKPSAHTDQVGSIVEADFVDRLMQGIDVVLHTATLHKPHVITHSRQDFIDTNLTGTLNLLEAAVRHGTRAFIFTSTTSTFGDAMDSAEGEPAVWVTETLVPQPKNIYGVTKTAAEDLCQLFHRNHGLPCLVLRTSRFFPEEDDSSARRVAYSDANLKANEMLFRRVDLQDIVDAQLLAMDKAESIGFDKFIITATTPFMQADRAALTLDAPAVVRQYYPDYQDLYDDAGWTMFPVIGRVYDNSHARARLGWRPQYDFRQVLDCLAHGKDFRSPLTHRVGIKGYHDQVFEGMPFPV